MEKYCVYIGTYTANGSRGIYKTRFDPASGKLEPVQLVADAPNPTFLTIHPNGRWLYAVSEVREEGGRWGGSVRAFAIDGASGSLRLINMQSTRGAGPCHVSVDRTGRWALAANYFSGSATIMPIREDGGLEEASDLVEHHGKGTDPERQEGPHAHMILPSPDNRFALVTDLGLDRVVVYRLDATAGRLTPNDPSYVELAPGAGPRHLAFHPSKSLLYCINELNNTITVFRWDAERGAMQELQTVSTLHGFTGTNFAADVHVESSGRFLYGSNREDDSIATFAIEETGRLSALGHEPVRGKWPRSVALDPTEGWLLAANQKSDSVTVLRRDKNSGLLTATDAAAAVSMPVCVKFARNVI